MRERWARTELKEMEDLAELVLRQLQRRRAKSGRDQHVIA